MEIDKTQDKANIYLHVTEGPDGMGRYHYSIEWWSEGYHAGPSWRAQHFHADPTENIAANQFMRPIVALNDKAQAYLAAYQEVTA